jgi:DNA polymerase
MKSLIDLKVKPCRNCWLGDAGHGPVPYSGPDSPQVVVIGEAPGPDEDALGEPFIGKAGRMMRQQLKEAQVRPEVTGFMNVVSCLPPGGSKPFRAPKAEEILACQGNFLFQLRVLKPEIVVLAGKYALEAFCPGWKITKERGRALCVNVGMGPIVAVPTFHPSAVLRVSQLRGDFKQDLLQVKWRTKFNRWGRWPESCRLCGKEVAVYSYMGAAYCERHRGWAHEDWERRTRYEKRQQLVMT